MDEHRQIVVATLPEGALSASDFEERTVAVRDPEEGEVRCRTLAITIGAGQRAGLQGSASYAGAPATGVVMGGTGVARVEASRHAALSEGDVVVGPTGWQERPTLSGDEVRPVDPSVDPATHLGLLGTNGLTAYVGMLDIGDPEPGETVVVSAAAGSVGHVAAQLARIRGARVVGVAGSDEKCRLLVDDLGLDAAVNHRDDLRAALADATPDRVNVYFDNTGGPILGNALFRMATGGRIVCCGVVSQYDTSSPEPGPRGIPGLLVNFRVRMQGFLIFDHAARFDAARTDLAAWAEAGDLRALTTDYDGLGEAPRAFVDLLAGATVGTTIVTLGT